MLKMEISNEEMASYLNMIFNSSELKNAYCQHPKSTNSIFQDIGNILAKYYISTGDNSFESAKKILDAYLLKFESEEQFFQDFLMPTIEEKVAQNLSMNPKELTLQDRVSIQEYVYARNKNNHFYTHCFPGALLEEVSTNGLDISRELFKDEYNTLATCFRTSFKTGELNYCELSSASLSYATRGMPERVNYSIGGVEKKSDNESLHDAYSRSLDENLQREYDQGHIDEETMKKMKQAGTKIIDFYAKGTSGIAVFRKSTQEKNKDGFINKILIKDFSYFGKELKGTCLSDIIDKGRKKAAENPEQTFEIYENMFKEIIQIFPEARKGISEFVNRTLAHNMSIFAISNYMHGGFADGYYVASGKMSPNEFAIVSFETPSEVVARSQMQNRAIEDSPQPSIQEKLDTSSNASPTYDQMVYDIKLLDKKFKQVTDISLRPEMIEMINLPNGQPVIVSSIDGKKRVAGNVLAAETEQGAIYYSFTGNIDAIAKSNIEDQLESLEHEEKEKIVEQFKSYDPEYDDDDIEEEALYWYAEQQYSSMPEKERESLKREILESRGKFIVYEKEGKAIISPLKDDTPTQEYSGEIIYSKDSEGKYNSFFEFIQKQYVQSVDELAKQVIPEMEDVQSQSSIQNAINSQINELNPLQEKGVQE